ncbi:polysaccharide deacetylase family protein [Microvirga sp. VF16]|uniref:polysaccharide deacetylase family protein n=1 Tax=Microvirga sp. VF16 TaxID=2807101 RepID=UPI00193CA074|nr:polysaccharide deacetylase family protein [Microvirga sp. VF16]QRM27224.1 polysaccharide deacetylase family protein [Microvirga sp. VF16]
MISQSDWLTVLCYHRIGNPDQDSSCSYRPNFSASIENFARQMKIVSTLFTPVSLREVAQSLATGASLPKRPALITFDDGYKDNGYVAWPIMRDLGIPGVVFLATDHIGTGKPFIWDYAAYCIQNACADRACIPLLGSRNLSSLQDRYASTIAWVEASKRLPAEQRWPAAEALASALGILPPQSAFSGLYLSWDEVRQLAREGLEFGGHTCSHPILTRLPVAAARKEIIECQERLTAELGRPAIGFAYPNGSTKDYDDGHECAVYEAGFAIAFTLEPGPSRLYEVSERPTAVRRIDVGSKDNIPRLMAKFVGAARLASSWKH